jgi:hypothetical protein
VVHFGVAKTFITGVQSCTDISHNHCICHTCIQGEEWTGTEWLSGLPDGVEESEQGRSARRCEIFKEWRYRRHVQYVTENLILGVTEY